MATYFYTSPKALQPFGKRNYRERHLAKDRSLLAKQKPNMITPLHGTESRLFQAERNVELTRDAFCKKVPG